ncbi:hypothetical protein RJ640_026452 [Escallonia rubra]|uniref:Uncharacterized protein n=1 Tax=Escallonia rubra TaxID=112253 RepID=A0AA88UIC9_9ASTE|nr:hypothetical protein RJ640_026452 [Escallonia rubra]
MRSEATNQSPFEIAIGQQPLTPLALAGDYKGRSPLAAQVARSWNEQADVVRSYLDKAGCKMKKWVDKRRRPKEYNLGDMVMLKLLSQQFKSFRKVHKGLIRKYEEPFPIMAKVGKVSYRLELPPKLKIHPVFHVSLLKPHYDDKEDPSCGESHRAPTTVVKSYDKEVEYVLSDGLERRRGVPPTRHYLKMVTVEEMWSTQRAEGPATIMAIGTATPPNCFLQNAYPDFYFRITNSKHKTELKEKFKRICKI